VKGRYPPILSTPALTLGGGAAWQARRESKRTLPQDHPETFPGSGISLVIDTVKEL
jgi:hypothetical protein